MSVVVAVSRSAEHTFSKPTCSQVRLLEGIGVEGDAHAGVLVMHRSQRGSKPNLRQVHLIQAEVLEEHDLEPGSLGENVTTRGIDLLSLSAGTMLHLGDEAVVQLTGLRTPCTQINSYRRGLMKAMSQRVEDGAVLRGGVMAIVVTEGVVRPGDLVNLLSPEVFIPLQRV